MLWSAFEYCPACIKNPQFLICTTLGCKKNPLTQVPLQRYCQRRTCHVPYGVKCLTDPCGRKK